MAAPEYVPVDKTRLVRAYESPPRRPDPWLADRPGELPGGQPRGDRLGNQGPDQGYVLTLARRFEGKLTLRPGEHERDALAGASAVALKRASLFGRAPVVHDLTVALTIWGFLGEVPPPAELIELRREMFEEVWHPHHYAELRAVADVVPEAALRMTPKQVADAHRQDWRSLLALEPAAG
ncbi:MAG: hypothetical protein ACRDYW_03955 [Acidimicrobiales bacterium]